jgi:hypothetical protein
LGEWLELDAGHVLPDQARMEPLGIVVFSCVMGTAGFSVMVEVGFLFRFPQCCTLSMASSLPPLGPLVSCCGTSNPPALPVQAVRELAAGTPTHLPNASFVIGAHPLLMPALSLHAAVAWSTLYTCPHQGYIRSTLCLYAPPLASSLCASQQEGCCVVHAGGTMAVIAMKLGMYLMCRGSSDPSVRAFALDHINDVVVNSVGLAGEGFSSFRHLHAACRQLRRLHKCAVGTCYPVLVPSIVLPACSIMMLWGLRHKVLPVAVAVH